MFRNCFNGKRKGQAFIMTILMFVLIWLWGAFCFFMGFFLCTALTVGHQRSAVKEQIERMTAGKNLDIGPN